MDLQSRSVILPPQRGYPFYVIAKRYTQLVSPVGIQDSDSSTLVLLHSTSFHKEIFEPTLSDLAALITSPDVPGRVKINEAWAIECPNHGESAVLNEELLREPRFREYFGCERYAEAAQHFLTATDENNVPYVNTTGRLVGIGHSLGGVSIVCLANMITFSSLVIVDPFFFPGKPEDLAVLRRKLINRAHERQDVWPSREEARGSESLKGSRKWDQRVRELYLRYGIRRHPYSKCSVTPYNGVTLACTREQEATMYRDVEGATKPIKYLDALCRKIPVHIAFGEKADIIERYVQNNIIDPSVRQFASITWIPDVGHLVPQQAPRALAEVIVNSIRCDTAMSRSKL